MTKVTLTDPSSTTFKKTNIGALFGAHGGVYIKQTETKATSIYKVNSHQTAGMVETFSEEDVVVRIKEATFIIG